MKTHLTMQQLENLGFKLEKSYVINNTDKEPLYITQVRSNGQLTIETTWQFGGEFFNQKIKINSNYIELLELDNLTKKIFEILNN